MTAHQLSFEQAFVPVSDRGKRVEKRVYLESGQIPVVDQGEGLIGGYTDDEALAYEGPLPVLVFGDHTRRIKFVDFPFAVGAQGIKLLQPRECWHPKYIAYQLAALKLDDRGYSRHYQLLRKETFVCPPLDEQRRIVAEIEEQLSRLDAGVAALKRVQANLKRYRASVLAAACNGSLVGLNSSEWPRHTLGEIATTVRNGFAGKPDAEQGTRIFRISAVRPLSLNVEDVRYLSLPITAYGESYVRPGDVLFTRYNGSRDLVGACAVVPIDIPPTVHPDKLIRVRVPSEILLPGMLALLASAGEGRSFLESRIRTTAGQSGISGSDLKALPLRLPPQNVQEQITAELDRRLSVVEELETQVHSDLARAERLRASVLSMAFQCH